MKPSDKPALVAMVTDALAYYGVVAPSLTPDSYTPALSKPAPSKAWSGFSF